MRQAARSDIRTTLLFPVIYAMVNIMIGRQCEPDILRLHPTIKRWIKLTLQTITE